MISRNFTPTIHRYSDVISTNATAKDLIRQGAIEGTVVVADRQTGGRGSGKRSWHSPVGGLYVSILLLPVDPRRPTDLSVLAGLATAQAVSELLPKSKDVTVKWPNDCLINWKKVSGVLCDAMGDSFGNYCIVGVGLNVNVPPEELEKIQPGHFAPTSFIVENAGGEFDLQRVADVFLQKLFTLYRLYHEQGFEPIRYLWQKNCRFVGKRVELREVGWKEGDSPKRGITVGTFEGIDESGALVLVNSKGERHHYFSGEISCFWQ